MYLLCDFYHFLEVVMTTVIVSIVMIAAIVGTYVYCVHQADCESGLMFKKRKESHK